jgi:hypothetical protein
MGTLRSLLTALACRSVPIGRDICQVRSGRGDFAVSSELLSIPPAPAGYARHTAAQGSSERLTLQGLSHTGILSGLGARLEGATQLRYREWAGISRPERRPIH